MFTFLNIVSFSFQKIFTIFNNVLKKTIHMQPTWGFAKSRPAAHGLRRPRGPRRSSGPEARRPGSPAARWPSTDFPQSFCPAVNPRACTDLHRVWACKMDDGEFEFIYHFNNHFNPFRSFLSLHVAKCMLCVWFENNFDNECPLSVSVK